MAGEDSKPEKMSSELARTYVTIRKLNSDDNSGVQKVRNRINCEILWNSEQTSQPSPNDEDLNICLESGANKLAFGKHQVRVSRT